MGKAFMRSNGERVRRALDKAGFNCESITKACIEIEAGGLVRMTVEAVMEEEAWDELIGEDGGEWEKLGDGRALLLEVDEEEGRE